MTTTLRQHSAYKQMYSPLNGMNYSNKEKRIASMENQLCRHNIDCPEWDDPKPIKQSEHTKIVRFVDELEEQDLEASEGAPP